MVSDRERRAFLYSNNRSVAPFDGRTRTQYGIASNGLSIAREAVMRAIISQSLSTVSKIENRNLKIKMK